MPTATRKCTNCKSRYPQSNDAWVNTPAGWFHNSECLFEKCNAKRKQIKNKRIKKDRVRFNEIKKQAKGVKHYIKITKQVAQEYAALRDQHKGCISCGLKLHELEDQWLTRFDGGHLKTTGAHPELQLNLNNISGQCRRCNGFDGGRVKDQEVEIVNRYGQARLDWLNGPHDPKKPTIEYLERYRKVIRKRMRRYKK